MNRKFEVEPGFDKDLRRDEFVRKNRNSNRHRSSGDMNWVDETSVRKFDIDEPWNEELNWDDDFSDIKDIWED